MNRLLFLQFSLISLLLLSHHAQAEKVRNADLVYDENIHTVLLYAGNDQLNDPVIQLDSDEKLLLSFDDINTESFIFYYTLIHCTSNWETTDIEQLQYLEGFFEDEITDYAFSVNAIPGYVHYQVQFPNARMKIKLSGNYIVKVYLNSPDDENVILTRRFFVYEPLSRIETSIPYYPKVLEFTRSKQQIDLTVYANQNMFMAEAQQRVNVVIRQNGRWDNVIYGIHPTSEMQNELYFNFMNGIVFDGGNNFRNFDMKSFWYQSVNIKSITTESDSYRVVLHTDLPRNTGAFQTVETINGRKFIQARADQNTAIEGEYAWVHFMLKFPKIENANVYLLGALNDWHFNDNGRMTYDENLRAYIGQLFLKQGYYEYLFAALPEGKTSGDVTLIEGDHFQTSNNYNIYVYYRERVPEYDRLVGYLKFNSKLVTTMD